MSRHGLTFKELQQWPANQNFTFPFYLFTGGNSRPANSWPLFAWFLRVVGGQGHTRSRRDAWGGRQQQWLCLGCPSPQAEAQGSQFVYPAHQQYRGEAARYPERRHVGGTGEGHAHLGFFNFFFIFINSVTHTQAHFDPCRQSLW